MTKFYVYTEFEGTKNNLNLNEAITELKRKGIYVNCHNPFKGIGVQDEKNNYNNDFATLLEGKLSIDTTKNIDMSIINKIRREVA